LPGPRKRCRRREAAIAGGVSPTRSAPRTALRALAAVQNGDDARASTDLSRALESGAGERVIDDALGSAQEVAFTLHEEVVLSDAAAFGHTYSIFSAARRHGARLASEAKLLIEANSSRTRASRWGTTTKRRRWRAKWCRAQPASPIRRCAI
jgi:hypothetical protein